MHVTRARIGRSSRLGGGPPVGVHTRAATRSGTVELVLADVDLHLDSRVGGVVGDPQEVGPGQDHHRVCGHVPDGQGGCGDGEVDGPGGTGVQPEPSEADQPLGAVGSPTDARTPGSGRTPPGPRRCARSPAPGCRRRWPPPVASLDRERGVAQSEPERIGRRDPRRGPDASSRARVIGERLGVGLERRKVRRPPGIENGSRPEASTAPDSTSANPCPPSIPEYQDCTMAGTSSSHSEMTTALPATMATTVRGIGRRLPPG